MIAGAIYKLLDLGPAFKRNPRFTIYRILLNHEKLMTFIKFETRPRRLQ